MAHRIDELKTGIKAIGPLMPGVIPFAMITGVAAVDAGIAPVLAFSMSFIVFAGASQLVAIQLLNAGAGAAMIIGSVFTVNLRLVMYSAAIAPHFRGLNAAWKLLFAYLLTDHSFAATLRRFAREDDRRYAHWHYLGAAAAMWAVWVAASGAGVVLGARVPESWSLDFTVPLSFLGLMIPVVRDVPAIGAACVAGAISLAAIGLPFNLELMGAAACGIAAGLVIERRRM